MRTVHWDTMCALLLFRVVPFATYGVAGPRVSRALRVFWAALFCAVALTGARLGLHVRDLVASSAIAMAYFVPIAAATHAVAKGVRRRRIPKSLVGIALMVVCIVVPGLVFPRAILAPAIVCGWEIMLSAYSYCADNANASAPLGLRDCMVFILVNPSVVYAQRGRPFTGRRAFAWGLMRCSLGVVAWAASDCVLGLVNVNAPPTWTPRNLTTLHGYYRFVRRYFAAFWSYYWSQSGLASIQIGFAAISGYRLPERYRFPFLSRSPAEFWNRWNIWVSSWAARYLFFPLSLGLQRRVRSRAARTACTAVAVMVTFLCMGGLHDLATKARASFAGMSDQLSLRDLRAALLFFWLAATLVAWSAVERLVSTKASPRRSHGHLGTLARACVVLQVLAASHAISKWCAG